MAVCTERLEKNIPVFVLGKNIENVRLNAINKLDRIVK
jgi:hypothetical protein